MNEKVSDPKKKDLKLSHMSEDQMKTSTVNKSCNKNSREKYVELCSEDSSASGPVLCPNPKQGDLLQHHQQSAIKKDSKNIECDIVVCEEDRTEEGRKQDSAANMFTSSEEKKEAGSDTHTSDPLVKQHKQIVTTPSPRPQTVNKLLRNVKEETPGSNTLSPLKASKSPSKSPGYFRKPMPINEPKPILPPSKQINLGVPTSSSSQPTSVAARSRQLVENFRKSVEENSNSLVESKRRLMRRISQEDPVIHQEREIVKTNQEENKIMKKSSTSPMSPRTKSTVRPSTLVLEKREKYKRCSAVSATPSSDSSKSSKTFEFIDYDEETKERILREALKEEEEFLEFVKTLDIEPPDPIIEAGKEAPKSRGHSEAPVASGSYLPGSKGQENLDSLCRMMEEIAALKDQNNKLTERLHYMEVSSRLPYPSIVDTNPQLRTWLASTGPVSPGGRCPSVGTESQVSDKIPRLEEVATVSPRMKQRSGGKWGRMKDAMKWERSPSDMSQPQLSLVSPASEVFYDDIKQRFAIALSSSSSSEACPTSSDPNLHFNESSLQRCSSVADHLNIKSVHHSSGTIKRRHSLTNLKDESLRSEKKEQSTWLKVKNLIYNPNRTDSLKKKSVDKNDAMMMSSPSDNEFVDEATKNEEVTRGKCKNPSLIFCNPDLLDTKQYSQSLSSMKTDATTDTNLLSPKSGEKGHSLPSSPRHDSDEVFFADDKISQNITDPLDISTDSRETNQLSEIQRDYEQLKRSLSEEFNKKMSAWSGQKKSSRDGACQSVTDESQLSADFRKKLDEWKRMKASNDGAVAGDDVVVQLHPSEQQQQRSSDTDFPTMFPWHKPKDRGSGLKQATPGKIRARPAEQKTLVEEDLKPEFKLKVAEWEVQKAMAGHSNRTTEELSKLMPDDFNKKYKEWEQLKVSKPADQQSPHPSPGDKKVKKKRKSQERSSSSKKVSEDRRDITAPEVGTFAWLDKELVKVNREKQRLERERLKNVEREGRLLAMRQALGDQSQPKKEITVKTRAGEEFKFEGINPKFTKKLYEWESRRGIAPECSTITLLQTGELQIMKNIFLQLMSQV